MAWRQGGQRLTTAVLVALLCAGAVLAAGAAVASGRWQVAIGSGALALVGGAGGIWLRVRAQRADRERLARRLSPSGVPDLQTVGDTDLVAMGIHPIVVEVPYVRRRQKETEVAELLDAGWPVLVVGSSMVGKTRLAAQVTRQQHAQRRILMPHNAADVHDLLGSNARIREHVVWLDDLNRFLGGSDPLRPAEVTRLAAENVVIATLRADLWSSYQPRDQLKPPELPVIDAFTRVSLDRDRDAPLPDDMAAAVPEAAKRQRVARVGIGEFVGAAHRLLERIEVGRTDRPLTYALLLGAVDWSRAGMLYRAVPAELLPHLAEPHVPGERDRRRLHDPEQCRDALVWLTEEINPTVSLLDERDDRFDGFVVYDFVLDRLRESLTPVPDTIWPLALDHATTTELIDVGYSAYHADRPDHAETAWRRAATVYDHPAAMNNLGVLLKERGEVQEAETWYRRAAAHGHPGAMRWYGSDTWGVRSDPSVSGR